MKTTVRESPPVIVIGASVGALSVLGTILPALPGSYPFAVVIVVHLPQDKKSLLASLFVNRCALPVKEAEDKEPMKAGTIYFAPPGYHLLIEPDFTLSLSSDEPVLYSRPSIDVLFESAADACGDSVVGVILTGANSDGARGLRTVVNAGGRAYVQLPESAEGQAMPLSALEICPEARSLSPEGIALELKCINVTS